MFSCGVICFVLTILKMKADREEQECLDLVEKGQIMLPNRSRTLLGRRTSSVIHYSNDVTVYKSESVTTTISYPSNKKGENTLKQSNKLIFF